MKTLTFLAYVPLALITEAPPGQTAANLTTPSNPGLARAIDDQGLWRLRILHGSIGLSTEVGELYDALASAKNKPSKLDKDNMLEEIGDLLWYFALLVDTCKGFIDPKIFDITAPKNTKRRPKFKRLLRSLSRSSALMLDITKKIVFYNRKVSNDDILRALAWIADDILGLCECFGLDPEKVMYANIAKLAERFGEKFSEAAANNRDIKAELESMNLAYAKEEQG